MVKAALIGYGKMGKMIDGLATEENVQIVSRFDSPITAKEIAQMQNQSIDVCIDFTQPDAILSTVEHLAKAGLNVVVGTTGWNDHHNDIKQIVQKHGIGLLWAPNFSIGIHLFLKILKNAADILKNHPLYDIAIEESHHKRKLDAPSGTALAIQSALKELAPDIPITSIRCGEIPGTHTVLFDSPCDTLSFTHTARNREGFARGALFAAKWLAGKKGFFTLDDALTTEASLCAK